MELWEERRSQEKSRAFTCSKEKKAKRHVEREKEKEKPSEITCGKKRKARKTRKARKIEGETK